MIHDTMAKLSRLTSRAAVIEAVEECDRMSRDVFLAHYGYGPARSYFLAYNGRLYDSKAIVGVAWGKQHGTPLDNADFSGGEKTVQATLERLGFDLVHAAVAAERQRRQDMWKRLSELAPGGLASPSVIAEVGIRPAKTGQGIFRDIEQTRKLAPDGVTLSLIDRGKAYIDEFDETGGIYHYPSTNRGSRDTSEIDATKAAHDLDLPLFVQIREGDQYRVHLGWVIAHSDETSTFLIEFDQPKEKQVTRDTPFEPFRSRSMRTTTTRQSRPEQRRFRFLVAARYKNRCAFCSIDHPAVLDAAHVINFEANGTDDPRNGLLLCATHHRAFDAGLLGIDPETGEIKQLHSSGVLGVERQFVREPAPAKEALLWRWNNFNRSLPGS